jgi:hypothetical protein
MQFIETVQGELSLHVRVPCALTKTLLRNWFDAALTFPKKGEQP